MLYKKGTRCLNSINPVDGIWIETLVHGEKTHMCRFQLKKGASLPLHSHPHEQTGFVLSGRIVMHIEGKDFDAGPGDAWCIKGGVPHGADVPEDSVIIEVFSPKRDDYLKG
jgi:quercetin dioxygenase-like cupin family protein